jgi:uncharacterized protein YbcI
VTAVAVWGVGTSRFGRQPDVLPAELAWQAVAEALADAGVEEVDAAYVGTVFGAPGVAQRALQGVGLTGIPIVTVENACASGTTAFHEARAAIASGIVRLQSEYYGKGPTKAKTFLNDNYVFCVMEGGLTRNEETLIGRGHEDLVRSYRLRFQEAMEDSTVEAIQRITSRAVIGYHSQIVFNPERAFEIFVLDRPVDGSG